MKQRKRIPAVFLALCILLGAVFCVPASADDVSTYQVLGQDQAPLNYDTLMDAMNAAQDGDTVIMTQDAEETFYDETVDILNKSVTLDLNGHTLSLSSDGLCEMINLTCAKLAVGDSSGNPGSIVLTEQGTGSGAGSSPLFCYIDYDSVLKITDGISVIAESEISCSDIIYVEGILGIINANFNETTESGACMIHASLGSKVHIRDCSCHWDDLIQTDENTSAYILNGFYETGSSLLEQQGFLIISGGTFNQNVSALIEFFCFLTEPDGQGYYYVCKDDTWHPGCEMTGVFFGHVGEAVEFALDGDTVKLLEDVTYTDAFGTKDITLDLNGHTVSSIWHSSDGLPENKHMFILVEAGLTICDSSGGNGAVELETEGLAYLYFGSKLTLKDGVTIRRKSSTFTDDVILVESGDVNIVNANFQDVGENNMCECLIRFSGGEATVNIAGGTFDWWMELFRNDYAADTIRITGGRFREDVSEWLADGYYLTEPDEDGLYTVRSRPLVAAHSLSLEGDIGVNFYVKIPDVTDEAYATFTVDGETVTVPVNPGSFAVEDGVTLYKFTCNVASAQIDTPITGKIYNGVDESEEFTYSVQAYLTEAQATRGDDIEFMALVSSLATYGYYANSLFGFNPDFNQHAAFDAGGFAAITATSLSGYAAQMENTADGVSYYGSSLLLRTETAVRHYFTLPAGKTIDDFTFILDTDESATELTATASGKLYYVEIPDIASANLGRDYTVIVFDGDGNIVNTWTYSAFSYVYKVLTLAESNSPSVSEALVNTAKALAVYCGAAEMYFAKIKE